MTEKKLGFYIFKGCGYLCIVFAVVSAVQINIIGAIGWLICAGILNLIAKKLGKDTE